MPENSHLRRRGSGAESGALDVYVRERIVASLPQVEASDGQQPAAKQHVQAVQRMHAVEEIATPALGWCRLLVLVVFLEERLLLVDISLEEEAADLRKGAV